MVFAQTGIIFGFICIAVAMSYYFLRRKMALQNTHRAVVNCLEMSIERHQRQLYFRNENLNKYHFLRYNLGEALVEQPDIKT